MRLFGHEAPAVMPMVKVVARGDTTMVDAYLTPHIMKYLDSFRSGFTDRLEDARTRVEACLEGLKALQDRVRELAARAEYSGECHDDECDEVGQGQQLTGLIRTQRANGLPQPDVALDSARRAVAADGRVRTNFNLLTR